MYPAAVAVLYMPMYNQVVRDERFRGEAFDTVLSEIPYRVQRDWRVGGRTVATELLTEQFEGYKSRYVRLWKEAA